ncbi:hypothetical protein ACFLS1_06550 [Verrucomicrobiota bacterium]
MDNKELLKRTRTDGLARVAFWQFMGFTIMLCLIWVNEIYDLAYLFFGIETSSMNIFRAYALSVVVIVCAVITVGHTYYQQKRIIQGLLTVCSYCHKIKIDSSTWKEMEKYITEHSLAAFSHGICPECFEKKTASIHD